MLMNLSNELAGLVETAAASVVQVRARGRAASGLVQAADLVLTTGRAIGRDEHPEVRAADGRVLPATLAGWDPATRLALLSVKGLEGRALTPGPVPRVGHLAVAIARSWSHAVTATVGLVSVIGGPLRTAPRRQIDQVIRTSAPMHEGFAGGALLGTDGTLLGVTTAAAIRGLGVVIPAGIAWEAAGAMLERGTLKRGYLGIVAQPVSVPERQRPAGSGGEALLVVAVRDGSPAADAGILVGDILVALDGTALTSPEDLLDLLALREAARSWTSTSPSPSAGEGPRHERMRVIIIGSPFERIRLRDGLKGTPHDVVGEFASAAEAQRSGLSADALLLPFVDSGRDAEEVAVETLTPRELQVLELIAEGLPNKVIGERLGISDQTVKFHVAAIAGKLGAANRTDAVRRAVRRGLIAL
jgi:S1-C subfamily serine protease/DNA-binding CsgD family transcriptional regulator